MRECGFSEPARLPTAKLSYELKLNDNQTWNSTPEWNEQSFRQDADVAQESSQVAGVARFAVHISLYLGEPQGNRTCTQELYQFVSFNVDTPNSHLSY